MRATIAPAKPTLDTGMASFDRPQSPETDISPWVRRFSALVRPGGAALDLACGHGRHARWLCDRGLSVVAVDIDVSGLADLSGNPAVEVIQADLEGAAWPLTGRLFDAVIITNYLHRPHFERLSSLLRPSGLLLIDTFAAGNEKFGRPRNPDFLLSPGELLRICDADLRPIAFEQGYEEVPRPAIRQRLCAWRSAKPAPLAPHSIY